MDAAAGFDDPAVWHDFGRPLQAIDGDGLAARNLAWESQVAVEGLHCAACAGIVESALLRVPGVLSAEVNAAARRARVVWDPARVQPSAWLNAAASGGYRLSPTGTPPGSEQRRRESRLSLWRWLVAGLCMMQVMMYAFPAYVAQPGDLSDDASQLLRWAAWVLTLPVLFFSCGPFFSNAWRDLRAARIGMDLPVVLGIVITFLVSSAGAFDPQGPLGHEVYFDSLTMFVFFLLTGRWLEARLRERTAGSLDALAHRLPESAWRREADESFKPVPVSRLVVGDIVRVPAGAAFPADGQLTQGDTTVEEALLTGESKPLTRRCGERVLAGSHNLGASVLVRIEAIGRETRFSRIVSLMDSAATSKPRLARIADRIARPFLLMVLLAAGGAAVLLWPVDHGRALMAAVSVLIVTCPCALSLATPAAMLASAGALARRGTLVRDLQAIESLARIDTVFFDKTGTLTRDLPQLEEIELAPRSPMTRQEALACAAAMAAQSLHPASRALKAAGALQAMRPASQAAWQVSGLHEHAGQGVEARVLREGSHGPDGKPAFDQVLRLGSAGFCRIAIASQQAPPTGMQVWLADLHGPIASFVLTEALRSDAAEAVRCLQQAGIQVRMLSGDLSANALRVAAQAGIDDAQGGCSPEGKLEALEQAQRSGRRVAMVGDGLNDGPVLARADASFSFGHALPLAQARADLVLLGESLTAVPLAIEQARRTMRVVRQNLAWAAIYNLSCVPLAVFGWLPAWIAGLGMALSSLVVVANAARLARPSEGLTRASDEGASDARHFGARPRVHGAASFEGRS